MPQPAATQPATWTQDAAYRYCEGMARTHYENFTVGSLLLPREQRRHVYAMYGYCRSVDDLGDEATPTRAPTLSPREKEVRRGTPMCAPPTLGQTHRSASTSPDLASGSVTPLPEGEGPGVRANPDQAAYRLALLDWWQSELEACYSGTPTHPVMVALQETIQIFDIPPTPFLKLIEANRMDQRIKHHATYAGLLHYCDHSANPVGRLFLYLFGYRDQERQRLADATCTALQLTNFWQDVARDYRKGRIYLPREDMERFGYSEAELAQGVVTDPFRQLLAFEAGRAMKLFREGAALVSMLEGPVKLDVALFTRGGVAVLDAIRRQDYDVLTKRPALSRTRKAALFASTWLTGKLGLGMGLPRDSRRKAADKQEPGTPDQGGLS
jgi:squalene synthase HpnC